MYYSQSTSQSSQHLEGCQFLTVLADVDHWFIKTNLPVCASGWRFGLFVCMHTDMHLITHLKWVTTDWMLLLKCTQQQTQNVQQERLKMKSLCETLDSGESEMSLKLRTLRSDQIILTLHRRFKIDRYSRALQVSQVPMGELENLGQGEAKGPQDLRDHRRQQESQWVGTYHQMLLLLVSSRFLIVWKGENQSIF